MHRFYLPNKKEGEEVVLMVRRHLFILFLHTTLWALAMLIPAVFFLVFQTWLPFILSHPFWYPFLVILLGSFYLLIWLFIFNQFVDYYLDVWIVTNYRILYIEQRGLFSRIVAENELDKIQDVADETVGMLPTFLDYGDVHIQTAAEDEHFVFEQVPHPLEIKRKITALCEYRKQSSKPTPATPPAQPPAEPSL